MDDHHSRPREETARPLFPFVLYVKVITSFTETNGPRPSQRRRAGTRSGNNTFIIPVFIGYYIWFPPSPRVSALTSRYSPSHSPCCACVGFSLNIGLGMLHRLAPPTSTFTLSHVLGSRRSTAAFYDHVVLGLVLSVVNGGWGAVLGPSCQGTIREVRLCCLRGNRRALYGLSHPLSPCPTSLWRSSLSSPEAPVCQRQTTFSVLAAGSHASQICRLGSSERPRSLDRAPIVAG